MLTNFNQSLTFKRETATRVFLETASRVPLETTTRVSLETASRVPLETATRVPLLQSQMSVIVRVFVMVWNLL